MANNKPTNDLIDYTKWLSKWVSIILLILCILGFGGWGIVLFIQAKVPMIAIQCEGEKIQLVKDKLLLYFLVQKERFSNIPYGIYFGANSREDFHKGTDVKDIILGSKLESSTDTHYLFGNKTNTLKYRINRGNLLVETFINDTQKLSDRFPIKTCIEITPKQFYEKTGNEVKRRKKT